MAGAGGSASGWFSTSTAASAETGDVFNTFGDMRPVYNQSAFSALEDIGVEKLAVIAGVVIVVAVIAAKMYRGK